MTTTVTTKVTTTAPSGEARPAGPAPGGDQVAGEPLTARLRRWRPFILAVGLLLLVAITLAQRRSASRAPDDASAARAPSPPAPTYSRSPGS